MAEQALYTLKGIDRASPPSQVEPGACLALQNLVPTGPPDGAHWTAPQPGLDVALEHDYLSIGWQTRQDLGALADTLTDPDQSLNRLVGLTAEGLYTIDPGLSYQKRQVWAFGDSDDTRRAQFAEVGDSLFICVTSGCNEVDELLELRGDVVMRVRWPTLPLFSISTASASGDDALPGGTYVFRFAWVLDDGTVGPSSGPYRVTLSQSSELTFQVDRYTESLPSGWTERLSHIAVLAQVPTTNDDGTVVEVQAIDTPAFHVANLDLGSGSEVTWKDSRESIVAGRAYEGIGLDAHGRLAGTLYSYNKRLLLGDVAYDLNRPELEKLVEWRSGVHNAGGDDHHLMMRVYVETLSGTIERLSEPLPFDSAHAASVAVRHGLIWYRDSRASRYEWLVSQNYTGDVAAADWGRVDLSQVFGVAPRRDFKEAAASQIAYEEVETTAIDITQESSGGIDALDEGDPQGLWAGQLFSEEKRDEDATTNPVYSDTPNQADLTLADVLLAGENAASVAVRCKVELDAQNDEDDTAAASATVTLSVLDSGGSSLKSDSISPSLSTTSPGSAIFVWLEVSGYTAANAVTARVDTSVSADVGSNDDNSTEVTARAEVVDAEVSVEGSTLAVQADAAVNDTLDRDVNRIVWSEVFRPLDMPPANVIYAGERSDDPVMAMRATGQEVSEGQYGQYPIVCFQQRSVRALQLGGQGEPFLVGVDVLTADTGLVSRRAVTTAEGLVIAALTDGVTAFDPQPQEPALSEPLHDDAGQWLCSLYEGAALAYYSDSSQGRNEIWVSTGGQTYVFSLTHGTWSTLTRDRRDYAPAMRLHGLAADKGLVIETGDPDGPPPAQTAEVVTAPMTFGAVGALERIQTLLIERRRAPAEIAWSLVALDPDVAGIDAAERERATLPDGSIAEDALPNAHVADGRLENDDFGSIPLPHGLGYSWVLRMTAEVQPGESIDAFGAEYDPRSRLRAPDLFPSVSEVATPCPPPDEEPRCPSDQRTFNSPPYWVRQDDLVWDTGNNPPVWEGPTDLVADQPEDTSNEAPYWVTQDDLVWSPEATYQPPGSTAESYLYTFQGGFSRFSVPIGGEQFIAESVAQGEGAIDKAAGWIFVPVADGVERYTLGGSLDSQILSGQSQPVGLAVDPFTQALYLSFADGSGIWWCNYDGTTLEEVIPTAGSEYSLAIVPDGGNGGYVFGASLQENEVARWPLVGDGTEKVIFDGDARSTLVVRHCVVHVGEGYVFWQTGNNAEERVQWRGNVDGSGVGFIFAISGSGTQLRNNTSWTAVEGVNKIIEIAEVEDDVCPVVEMDLDGNGRQNAATFFNADTGKYIAHDAELTGGSATGGPGSLGQTNTLTVDSAQIGSDLTNFPVYVDLSDLPQAFWDTVSADGSDIRVYNSSDVELDREVVAIDTTAQTGELHFKADSIAAASDTDFTIECGGSDYTGTPADVWSNGYALVLHLEATPGSSAVDSTANGYDGTLNGTPTDVAGQLGRALEFGGGTSGDYITHGDVTELNGAAEATIQAWLEDYDAVDPTEGPKAIEKQDGTNTFRIFRHGSDSNLRTAVDVGSGRAVANGADTLIQDGSMHHVVARWQGDVLALIVDGTQVASDSTQSGSLALAGGDWHESNSTSGKEWDGRIDEVRVSSVGRSDDWLSAEHVNQSAPTTFYTIS